MDLLTRSFQKHVVKNLFYFFFFFFLFGDINILFYVFDDTLRFDKKKKGKREKLTTVAPIFSVLRLFRERRLIVSPFLSAGFKFSLWRDRECLVLVALSCLTIRSINWTFWSGVNCLLCAGLSSFSGSFIKDVTNTIIQFVQKKKKKKRKEKRLSKIATVIINLIMKKHFMVSSNFSS